jgi:hypothetical protein
LIELTEWELELWLDTEHMIVESASQQTRMMRYVNLERRSWNEKLKDGQGDWDSTSSYSLGDIHNVVAVMQLAVAHLCELEADLRESNGSHDHQDAIQFKRPISLRGWPLFCAD